MATLPEKDSGDYIDEPFTFEREIDGDGVADVVRLQESSGS